MTHRKIVAGGAPALQHFSAQNECDGRSAKRMFVGQALRLRFGVLQNRGELRNLHFLPNAAFLLPVVERFAVDFVNGRFRDSQFPGLYHHIKINVVNLCRRRLSCRHKRNTCPRQTREPVVMDFDQVQREIFPLIRDMKFVVGGFRSVAADKSLKSVRNVCDMLACIIVA